MTDQFVPISFAGTSPQWWYNAAAGTVMQFLVIGTGLQRWKLEIDLSDGYKLKMYFSSDGGVTWVTKFAVSP